MLFDGRREEAVRISMKEGVSDGTIRKRIIIDWMTLGGVVGINGHGCEN